jgi:hypothetical protein
LRVTKGTAADLLHSGFQLWNELDTAVIVVVSGKAETMALFLSRHVLLRKELLPHRMLGTEPKKRVSKLDDGPINPPNQMMHSLSVAKLPKKKLRRIRSPQVTTHHGWNNQKSMTHT